MMQEVSAVNVGCLHRTTSNMNIVLARWCGLGLSRVFGVSHRRLHCASVRWHLPIYFQSIFSRLLTEEALHLTRELILR